MSGKSFAVIGLGQFGMTLAKELANADYDVLELMIKMKIFRKLQILSLMQFVQMCASLEF